MARKAPERRTNLQIKQDRLKPAAQIPERPPISDIKEAMLKKFRQRAISGPPVLKYAKKVTLQVEVTYYDQGALPPCDVRTTTENGVKLNFAGASAVDSLAQMAVQLGSLLDLQRWVKDGLADICSRADGHTGPCNGHPRLNCPGL